MSDSVNRDLFDAEIKRLIEKIDAVDRLHSELGRERNRALEVGLTAAKEKSESHNDVLGAMKDQQSHYVTKGQIYAALIAAVAVLGLVVTYYANFGGTG